MMPFSRKRRHTAEQTAEQKAHLLIDALEHLASDLLDDLQRVQQSSRACSTRGKGELLAGCPIAVFSTRRSAVARENELGGSEDRRASRRGLRPQGSNHRRGDGRRT